MSTAEMTAGTSDSLAGTSSAAALDSDKVPLRPVVQTTQIPDDDPLKGRWKEGTFGHPDRNIGGSESACWYCTRLVFLVISLVFLGLGIAAFVLGLVGKEHCADELRDCLDDCHNVLPDEECAKSCTTQTTEDEQCNTDSINSYNLNIWGGALVTVIALISTIYMGCSYGLGMLSKKLRDGEPEVPKTC